MNIVSAQFVKDKRVLLRMDFDVPIKNGIVQDDLRLQAALPTLELCLLNASSVVLCGHIGRPKGVEVPDLTVRPIVHWIEDFYCDLQLPQGRLHILENLRFEKGEDAQDFAFAKELAAFGDVFVNEAFAAHRMAASTTVVPTLLPSAAGLHFAHEVETLTDIRNNPKKPLVVIIGGAKVEDKYNAIVALSKIAEHVLVGGLLSRQIKEQNLPVSGNVILSTSSPDGLDISKESIEKFISYIRNSKQIIWAGPMGKYEDPKGREGNKQLAKAVIDSKAFSVIGGGDSIAALNHYLDQFNFVSIGGGAMLKLLCEGSLPTIKALENDETK